MKNKLTFYIFILFSFLMIAQTENQPKLVVGIVVDQMRYDYLEKYYNDFSENGFKKLINQGSNFTNCLINYIPTVTGSGHASVYTGTTPYYNGIVSNDWIDRKSLTKINCVDATRISNKPVGKGIVTNKSPDRLLSTTIGDQIILNNYGKSKVISISSGSGYPRKLRTNSRATGQLSDQCE